MKRPGMQGRAACYLRVSTDDQDEENQRADVEALTTARRWQPAWFVDHGLSGRTRNRPAYLKMMEEARRGRFKAIVVWKLDRLGRSVKNLVEDLDHLRAWGVDLVSVRDPIDTTTPAGRAMFQLAAVFAELEAANTSDRTKTAYRTKKARARSLGQPVRWGRKRKEVPQAAIQAVLSGELSQRAAAREYEIPQTRLSRAIELIRNGGSQDAGDSTPEGESDSKGLLCESPEERESDADGGGS